MTKDEKTLEQVKLAVAQLKKLPPPREMREPAAARQYYAIFDGPVSWKAGIRTPEEVGAKTVVFGAKGRRREKPADAMA